MVRKMSKLVNLAQRFATETDGPTATEYAVMLALIIVVSVAAISALGNTVSQMFSAIDATLAVPSGKCC